MSRFLPLAVGAIVLFAILSILPRGGALADTPTPTPSPSPPNFSNFGGVVCVDANCENLTGTVTASIGGTVCDDSQIGVVVDGPVNQTYYSLAVPAAAQQSGCGTEGATIDFAVNGRTSGVTGVWHPNSQQTADIVVGEPFAAFSGKLSLNGAPVSLAPDLPILKAFIGGVECGSRTVSTGFTAPGVTTVGSFTWLIVYNANARTGCGTDGAKIAFTLNGIPTAETASWSSGFHTLDLGATKIASGGNLGGSPSENAPTWQLLMGWALILTGIACAAGATLRRREL